MNHFITKNQNVRFFLLALLTAMAVPRAQAAKSDGELELVVVDTKTGGAIPVRVELTNSRNRPVKLRDVGVGHLGNHFYLPGQATLPMRKGRYLFELDSGAEYRTRKGHFEIDRHANDSKRVEMNRFATLAEEGWWGGDLDLERSGADLPLMAAAEGLHYAANTAWRFDGKSWQRANKKVRDQPAPGDPFAVGRSLAATAAVIESPGGTLLLVADKPLTEPPLEIAAGTTLSQCAAAAREAGLHVVLLDADAWQLPVLVADGNLNAMCLLDRRSEHRGVSRTRSAGRPHDRTMFPGPSGFARADEMTYDHLLNCGIHLPIVGGSGSGGNASPIGTNRTYAYCGGRFAADAWWQAVDDGATVVTNGPLLRPSVGGEPPGVVFQGTPGGLNEFELGLNLASRDHVDYLEVLKNGEVLHELRLADWAAAGGKIPPIPFETSGWFAVRVATSSTEKYQYARSGAYWVQFPSGPRASRESVEYFLTWLDDLSKRDVAKLDLSEDDLHRARSFWKKLLQTAVAE